MKYMFMFVGLTIILLFLLSVTACGGSGGGNSSSSPTIPTTDAPPTDPVIDPPIVSTPVITTPVVTDPAPVVDPPVVTPDPPVTAPSPPAPVALANLTCDNSPDCTGGNLGLDVKRMDLDGMFTGGNPQVFISTFTVQNDVNATTFSICTQPHGPGCKEHSVCIYATLRAAGQSGSQTFLKCGNALDSNRWLEQI